MSNAALLYTEVVYLNIDKIIPNPYQPRKIFEKTPLEELAKSIKQYGVMQPISVRFINGTSYELVAGERRLRASKLAGFDTIPALIINISDKDSAAIALIENIQRRDLNFLEEAEGFYNLIEDYGYTQDQLANVLGKNQSTIANKIRLLKLSYATKKMIIENGLTERHARALLRISEERVRRDVLDKIIKLDLNVKKAEELIDSVMNVNRAEQNGLDIATPGQGHKIKRVVKDVRLFTNSIKQAVQIMNESGVVTDYDIQQNDDFYEISIRIKK